MITKDRLKEKIILHNGFTYYVVKDLGSFKKSFVLNQFNLYINKLKFKDVLNDIKNLY